jgi:hypothetical protein
MTSGNGARQTLEELARAVEVHGGGYGIAEHRRVLDLCAEAVAFAREDDAALVGTRARSSAQLLLELVCPHLTPTSVHQLSIACERAALRLG